MLYTSAAPAAWPRPGQTPCPAAESRRLGGTWFADSQHGTDALFGFFFFSSLKRKVLSLAESHEVPSAVISYPSVSDIAGGLFSSPNILHPSGLWQESDPGEPE